MPDFEPEPMSDNEIAEILREAGPRPPLPSLDQPPLDPESLGAPALAVWQRQTALRRARRRRYLAAAASVVLALAALLLWRLWAGAPIGMVIAHSGAAGTLEAEALTVGATFGSGEVLSTSSAEWLTVELTNGHRLRLDAGTELTLMSAKLVRLVHGGVYVEATTAPLLVQAGDTLSEHLGTRYSVRHDPPAQVSVRVRHGRVRVRRGDESVQLGRAQAVTIGPSGLEVESSPVHGPTWDWTRHAAPPFQSDGALLTDFLQWIEAESGWRVEADPSLLLDPVGDPVQVHGIVEDLPLEQALSVMLESSGLQYRLDHDVVRITGGDD